MHRSMYVYLACVPTTILENNIHPVKLFHTCWHLQDWHRPWLCCPAKPSGLWGHSQCMQTALIVALSASHWLKATSAGWASQPESIHLVLLQWPEYLLGWNANTPSSSLRSKLWQSTRSIILYGRANPNWSCSTQHPQRICCITGVLRPTTWFGWSQGSFQCSALCTIQYQEHAGKHMQFIIPVPDHILYSQLRTHQ